MRKWSLFALAAMSVVASAQVLPGSGGVQQFIEQPGVMEFSGRMTVRPLQLEAMLQKGVPYATAEARRAEAKALVSGYLIRYIRETDESIIEVPLGQNENGLAQRLMASGDFEYVTPDWVVYPLAIPNDPSYASQWHLPKIEAPAAWNYYTGGGNVIVAITDTGVRTDHQDLIGQLVSGANSATGTAIPQTSGGLVEDINGHGSHCAGIAGATGNNAIGVSGVNWNVKIMPVRVTNSSGGGSTIAALTAGARWAADNGARVVSTSYSGVSDASVQTTGNYIKVTRNGLYCWAAGNDNLARTVDHADVTIVGASDQNDAKASFSAFGIAIDVFAPGVSILSTYNTSSTAYATLSGTSMACPCTAGLAALITGTNPALTAQEVEDILYQTCTDLTAAPGGPGNDNYWGWGRINARAALQRSYNTKPFNPTAYTIQIGTAGGGGLGQLGAGDNQYLLVNQEAARRSRLPARVEFETASTNNATTRVDFIIESAASAPGLTQTVEMFDYTLGNFVVVDSRVVGTADATLTLTPASSTRFQQAGTGKMRSRVTFSNESGVDQRNVVVRFDRIGWTTAP